MKLPVWHLSQLSRGPGSSASALHAAVESPCRLLLCCRVPVQVAILLVGKRH